MPVIVNKLSGGGSDFIPVPKGVHNAICVDAIDLGMVPSKDPGKPPRHMLRLVFEVEAKKDDGCRMTCSNDFALYLSPTSNLSKFLQPWLGRPFAENEAFDTDTLVGKCALLVVTHKPGTREGLVFANFIAAEPVKEIESSGMYNPANARKRIADKKAAKEAGGAKAIAAAAEQLLPPPAADQDVSFLNPATGQTLWRSVVVHFGKSKGTPLGQLEPKALDWFITSWNPSDWPKGSGKFSQLDLTLRQALDVAKEELVGQPDNSNDIPF